MVELADTRSKQAGKDIVARKDSRLLWVTVKGYPEDKERTSPPTMARQWFSQALFDIILWRGEDTAVELAVALPNFPTYRRLASKVKWFQLSVPFLFLWVGDDGSIEAEGERSL